MGSDGDEGGFERSWLRWAGASQQQPGRAGNARAVPILRHLTSDLARANFEQLSTGSQPNSAERSCTTCGESHMSSACRCVSMRPDICKSQRSVLWLHQPSGHCHCMLSNFRDEREESRHYRCPVCLADHYGALATSFLGPKADVRSGSASTMRKRQIKITRMVLASRPKEIDSGWLQWQIRDVDAQMPVRAAFESLAPDFQRKLPWLACDGSMSSALPRTNPNVMLARKYVAAARLVRTSCY